jgi:hypothetical protein
MSGVSLARSWVERDLQRGDMSFLRDFAFFRNRRPPSAVVDRLRERGFLAKTERGRSRMTMKGWCLASEQRTREEITKNWSTFPAADRIGCVKSLTFSPTYTELLTCLEMRLQLKNSRDAKPTDTKPQR